MTQLAAQMYTTREFTKTPAELAQTLKKIRQVGYEAVQVSGICPVAPAELAKMLKDNGLTCCSTHTGWDRFVNEIDKVIDEHRLWGCTHPAIGGMPSAMRNDAGVLQFALQANAVGQKLSLAGMDFSYHNHNFEFRKIGKKTWLDLFYENTDPRYVKAELDTHWVAAGGGDPAAYIKKYAGRMPILHLKDMAMGLEGQRFAEIGEGNLNWPAILAAAKQAGVEWYCIEQDQTYGRDPFDSLKISLDNLHAMGMK